MGSTSVVMVARLCLAWGGLYILPFWPRFGAGAQCVAIPEQQHLNYPFHYYSRPIRHLKGTLAHQTTVGPAVHMRAFKPTSAHTFGMVLLLTYLFSLIVADEPVVWYGELHITQLTANTKESCDTWSKCDLFFAYVGWTLRLDENSFTKEVEDNDNLTTCF